MGLRINNTVGVYSLLRQMNFARLDQAGALERIATGLQINRAADNPAGLVISETLRTQLGSIAQLVENTQAAANMVTTAEGGLAEISSLLADIRSRVVGAMNAGGLTPEMQAANQMMIDMGLQSINRIAETTRFGGNQLLAGAAAFRTGNVAAQFSDIRIMAANLPPGGGPTTIEVNVTAAAERALAAGTIAPVQAAASTIQIRGPRGSVELTFAAGATQAEVMAAINAATPQTGVEAVGGQIRSVEYGSAAFVQFTVTEGTFSGITPGYYTGADIQGTVEGQPARGIGNQLNVAGAGLTAQIQLDPGTGPGTYTFDILGGGLGFQLGTEAGGANQLRVGIEPMTTARLGLPGSAGNLATLMTGGANTIQNNPDRALQIVDAAINQVAMTRGQLGAVARQQLQPNISTLQVTFENLSAAQSYIRDADVAREAINAQRGGTLLESAVRALRAANISQGGVLRLLG